MNTGDHSESQAREPEAAPPNDQHSEAEGVERGVQRAVMRAVGYVRVSTHDQATTGASLEAQKTAIQAGCARRGWELLAIEREAKSASGQKRRPVLERAISSCVGPGRRHDVLVVSMMDRAFRSTLDMLVTVDRAKREGWQLVILQPDVDMTTPYGRAMAGMAAVFAELERELIAQRTRNGIAARVAAGTYRGGRVSNPPEASAEAVARILDLKAEGVSLRGIAARLGLEGFVSPRGGAWSHTTVGRVLERAGAGVG